MAVGTILVEVRTVLEFAVPSLCWASESRRELQNGSDHAVVASYSGLHEECEVNISTYLAEFSLFQQVFVGSIKKRGSDVTPFSI